MTLAGKLAALLPLIFTAAIAMAFYRFVQAPSLQSVGILLGAIYILPLTVYRLHNLFFPLQEDITAIAEKKYSPWWTSHQIQLLYIAVPSLEAPLHFVPGLFSLWLRLWGSKIGKGVYWTPRVEVIDRGLLEVGHGVVVGHFAVFCSHAISPVNGKLSLIVRKVRVGDGAFLGAETRYAPGATIEAGQLVKARTAHWWKGQHQ